MKTGVIIAIVTVLVIVIGVFLLVGGGGGLIPLSNGNGPGPDPQLAAFIKAVQAAAKALDAATKRLTDVAKELDTLIAATYADYDSQAGVHPPADSVRKAAETGAAAASKALDSYAEGVAAFDALAAKWSTATSPYKILEQKTAADQIKADAMKPMAQLLNAEGGLLTLVASWAAEYEAASEGSGCKHGSDCDKYHQTCSGGHCVAKMGGTMLRVVKDLEWAAHTFKVVGTRGSSPLQQKADLLETAYTQLFDNIVGAP